MSIYSALGSNVELLITGTSGGLLWTK